MKKIEKFSSQFSFQFNQEADPKIVFGIYAGITFKSEFGLFFS